MQKIQTSKIIILRHGGGELANQLWNYVSIYAYGLDQNIEVRNPSFFEYHSYFKLLQYEGVITHFFSFWFKNFSGRRTSLRARFWRCAYSIYSHTLQSLTKSSVVSSENQNRTVTYLPPTSTSEFLKNKKRIYFIGWLFRNPIGINTFRERLIESFTPNKIIEKKVYGIISHLRQKYEHVIGIHIRQHDYKTFKGGFYFINQDRVKKIIDEYTKENNLDATTTLFLITSDGKIDESIFKDLNIYISKENAVTDLFLLSKTDAIIGSDSSFGAFASWYGNIPHIVMNQSYLDWEYYRDKKRYFENKYSTLVNF